MKIKSNFSLASFQNSIFFVNQLITRKLDFIEKFATGILKSNPKDVSLFLQTQQHICIKKVNKVKNAQKIFSALQFLMKTPNIETTVRTSLVKEVKSKGFTFYYTHALYLTYQ